MQLNPEKNNTYHIFEDKLATKFREKHNNDTDLQNRIDDKYYELSLNPYAEAEKSFKSNRCPKCMKTRLGVYRIIYYIYPARKEIQILDIGHRKNIYKKGD